MNTIGKLAFLVRVELLQLLVDVTHLGLDDEKFQYARGLGLDVWFQDPLLIRKLIHQFHRLKIS